VADTEINQPGWRECFPRGVQDPLGPRGELIETPTDRRLLWHIADALSVMATSDHIRELQNALTAYLHETCRHHWGRDLPGDEVFPPHRQCLWCSYVEWLTKNGPRPLAVAEGLTGRPDAEDRTCWRCGEEYTDPLPLIGGLRFCPRDLACRIEAELRAAEAVSHAG
jgi:hypothetical protein